MELNSRALIVKDLDDLKRDPLSLLVSAKPWVPNLSIDELLRSGYHPNNL